jgi:putative sulfotransferase
MLAEHPDVCSIFEFFTGLDWGRRFAGGSLPGEEFAELISRPQPVIDAVLRRGYSVEEVTYPFGQGRFARGDTMPWILVSMLPRIADDPDKLFDQLVEFAKRLPTQPVAAHYRALFEWLALRKGRHYWIERSGSSIDYLASLYATFPEALVVHIHRDGREAALSMREHHAYRVPISLMYDAPVASGRRPSELGPIDLTAPPNPDDPISQVLASRPPVEAFGRYWSDQVVRGSDALTQANPTRFLAVQFEDLIGKPVEVLSAIATFFALPVEGGWLARGAGLVHGVPAPRVPMLSERERAALDAAVHPGMTRLGRS